MSRGQFALNNTITFQYHGVSPVHQEDIVTGLDCHLLVEQDAIKAGREQVIIVIDSGDFLVELLNPQALQRPL